LRAARLGGRATRPGERVLFSLRHTLNVDQLLDDLFQRAVIELELPPQHPQRQTTVLLEMAPNLADNVEEIHRTDSASSSAMRSASAVVLCSPLLGRLWPRVHVARGVSLHRARVEQDW
jgi:hypothetical protein